MGVAVGITVAGLTGRVQVNIPLPFLWTGYLERFLAGGLDLTLNLIQIYLPFELEQLFGGDRNFLSGARTNKSPNFAYASLPKI
jgi:hypothetical protein